MKKLSFYLLFIILTFCLFASCSDDSFPPPEVSNPKTTGFIRDATGKSVVVLGDTVTFSVVSGNSATVGYEWYINDEFINKEEVLVYTPQERGYFTVKVRVHTFNGSYAEYIMGTYKTVLAPIEIISVNIDGNPVSLTDINNFSVEDGKDMAFSLSLGEGNVIGYHWVKSNDTISMKDTTSLTKNWSGSYDFKVYVTNEDSVNSVANFVVNVNGPYKNGIFIYGTTYEDLAFFDPEIPAFYEGNIYEKANGHKLGVGGINDLFIADNRLYLMTPNGNNAKISICDAQTLKEMKTIVADNFNMSSLGSIHNMVAVNDNKFYIGYNRTSNESGIRVLEANENGVLQLASEDIPDTGGALGAKGPAAFARMLKIGKYVWAGCGSKILVIDSETNSVYKNIEIDSDRQIADLVKGRDGKVYALIAGKADKSDPAWLWSPSYSSKASIMGFNSQNFSQGVEIELEYEENQLDIRAGHVGNGAVASLNKDQIFFVVGNENAPGKIYCYNYTTYNVMHIMDQVDGNCGKYMGTDKKGRLYIPLIKNSQKLVTSVYSMNDSTSTNMPDIEALIGEVAGDGGYTSTYRF